VRFSNSIVLHAIFQTLSGILDYYLCISMYLGQII